MLEIRENRLYTVKEWFANKVANELVGRRKGK